MPVDEEAFISEPESGINAPKDSETDEKPLATPPVTPVMASATLAAPPSPSTSVRPNRRRKSSSARSIGSQSESIPPSSPAQVFRNLLISEESFREQYIILAKSRRKHIIFFSILVGSMTYFTYSVFVDPSIYRAINFFDRLMFMVSGITLGLFYLTGLYNNAFLYSPKFIHNANKGIRTLNIKIVKIPPTWKESILRLVWDPVYCSQQGQLIKIVLSSRVFTTDTIDAWEIYRQDYWLRENERVRRVGKRPSPAKPTTNGGVSAERRIRTRKRTLSKVPLTQVPALSKPAISDHV
jgi:hypothetical protein